METGYSSVSRPDGSLHPSGLNSLLSEVHTENNQQIILFPQVAFGVQLSLQLAVTFIPHGSAVCLITKGQADFAARGLCRWCCLSQRSSTIS